MANYFAQELIKAKKNIKSNDSLGEMIITQKINRMFTTMRDDDKMDEVRVGLHASAILAGETDFCYRQQVLSLLYEMDQGKQLSVGQLKIFSQGSCIHEKYQTMFEKCSKVLPGFRLIKNEARSYIDKWQLSFTPDAIVEIDDALYIVEIKSMNEFAFKTAVKSPANPHPSGIKQCMFYMYLTGIPNGIVLMENKNNQEILVHKVQYDYNKIIPYIDRLNEIQVRKEDLIKNHVVPERMCKNCNDKKAEGCGMRDACFNIGKGRIKLK